MNPSRPQYSHSSLRHKIPQLNRKVINELQREKKKIFSLRASFLFIVTLIKLESIKKNYHHHKF